MKFIQQEGHVLQLDTMMPLEVQLITDPEMWIVSIYLNKTGICLNCDLNIIHFLLCFNLWLISWHSTLESKSNSSLKSELFSLG